MPDLTERRVEAAAEALYLDASEGLNHPAWESGLFEKPREEWRRRARLALAAADRVTPDDHVDHEVLREMGVETEDEPTS